MEWEQYIDLARSKEQQGQHEEAIQCYNEALAIAQSTQQEASTLEQLGGLSLSMEKYHDAEDYFQKGLPIAQKTGDKKLQCNMCNGLAKAHENLENCRESLKCAKKALQIALETEDLQSQAKSYDSLANACAIHCEYENSIEHFKKAIDLYKQLEDENSLAKCYAELSSTYREHGNYHDAFHFQQESLKLSEKLGNKEYQANSLYKIATILFTLKKN